MEYNLRHNADIVHLAQVCAKELDSTPLKMYFARIYGDQDFLDTIKFPEIDEKVKIDTPTHQGFVYWVSEVDQEMGTVLVRTTFDKNHPEYNDYWVTVKKLKF